MIDEKKGPAAQPQAAAPLASAASVYCPICTHTVHAEILSRGRSMWVRPDQRCPRCSASLAAGKILWLDRAA